MKTVIIEGQVRETFGKVANKKLRRADQVPCVLYGGEKAVHFSAASKAFKNLIYTPDFKKATLQIDGNTYEALTKELQFHPVTEKLIHIDFQELVPGKKILTEIPVKLEGLPVGVKAGGKLLLTKRKLKVKILPENLTEALMVDVSELELGKSIKVSSVEAPGMEIMTPASNPIAMVEVPRALKSEASKSEDGTEEEGAEAPTEEG